MAIYKCPPIPKIDPLLLEKISLRRTLYLNADTEIDVAEGELIIHSHREGICKVPLAELQLILAIGNVEIPARILPTLLRKEIAIVFFASNGEVLGRMEAAYRYSDQGNLLKYQVEISPQQRLNLTQRIVWGTLRNYRRYLYRCQREGRSNELIQEAIEALDFSINQVYRKDALESVAGLLGSGLCRYYSALATHVAGWDWIDKKTPTPLNAMLKFSHSLLHQSVRNAIVVAGLAPDLGIWHSSNPYQDGLVLDLMAEFKVFADAVVVRCINLNQVALKDFDNWEGGKSLPSNVATAIAESYQRKMMREFFTYPATSFSCSYQESIFVQVKQIVECLKTNQEFAPLNLR